MRVVASSVTELSFSSSHRRLEHLVPRHHDVTRSTAATSSAHNAANLHCSSAESLSQSIVASYCIVLHSVKLKFHWDQFPRNFPVANVTGKSPTSYEEVGRVGACYEEVTGNWSQWNLSLMQYYSLSELFNAAEPRSHIAECITIIWQPIQ